VASALEAALTPAPSARILLPQSALAGAGAGRRPALARRERDGPDRLPNRHGQRRASVWATCWRAGDVDAVTFTSGSTVTNCRSRLSAEGADPALLAGVVWPASAQDRRNRARGRSAGSRDAGGAYPGSLVAALDEHFSSSTTGDTSP